MASNISKIKDYISGTRNFQQCVDAAEIKIVKGNKEKALELLIVAKYLNINTHVGKEVVTAVRFRELEKRASE